VGVGKIWGVAVIRSRDSNAQGGGFLSLNPGKGGGGLERLGRKETYGANWPCRTKPSKNTKREEKDNY